MHVCRARCARSSTTPTSRASRSPRPVTTKPSMSKGDRYVIVGMSMAGLRAAEMLRRLGHEGPIVALSAEIHDPYDRPPLSKELLAGAKEPADITLRRDGVNDLALDWRRGVRAAAL